MGGTKDGGIDTQPHDGGLGSYQNTAGKEVGGNTYRYYYREVRGGQPAAPGTLPRV